MELYLFPRDAAIWSSYFKQTRGIYRGEERGALFYVNDRVLTMTFLLIKLVKKEPNGTISSNTRTS